MKVLYMDDLRKRYRELGRYVVRSGEKFAPRELPTYEVRNVALVFPSPECATFPIAIGRKISPAILSAELMQWVAGVSDLAQLNSTSHGRFKNYSDDGTRLYGAYGPRAYRGLARAVRVLQRDTLSRQASVSIWRALESDETTDLPCTLSWSFTIRDGFLDMTTVMRSNDVWTGVPYDIPSMARIQSAMAWALGVEGGRYTHVVHSLHVYESDVEGIEKIDVELKELKGDDPRIPPMLAPLVSPVDTEIPEERWRILRDVWALGAVRAWELDSEDLMDIPNDFAWYANHLQKHRGYAHFCERCRYFLPQDEIICADILPPVRSNT